MEYIETKTLLSGYSEGDSWFGCNYNMNIYRGCCHGCIYCDSRSECYRIEDFEKVGAKKNSIEILKRELKSKRRTGVIGTGSMSDPYNPFEKELKLSRQALEWIDFYEYGVSIITKSDLIIRDIDLLKSISQHSPVLCKITITTADESLCRIVEPKAPGTRRRIEAIRKLSEAGVFTGVLLMPVLPFINDTKENIMEILQRAKDAGARFVYPAFGVTLRTNQREYFYEQLDRSFPGIKEKYIHQYLQSYRCESPMKDELWKIFEEECNRLGLLYKMKDIIGVYKKGYGPAQLSMF